jgi:hypothetical protein
VRLQNEKARTKRGLSEIYTAGMAKEIYTKCPGDKKAAEGRLLTFDCCSPIKRSSLLSFLNTTSKKDITKRTKGKETLGAQPAKHHKTPHQFPNSIHGVNIISDS